MRRAKLPEFVLCRGCVVAAGVVWLSGSLAAAAQSGPEAADADIDVVVVTGEPLGVDVDADRIAGATAHVDAAGLQRTGASDMLGALEAQVAGVSLNQAQGNPFQPSIVYRGFEASPLQGNAQGIAVYLDGSRFNQAFGDTVDWDTLPSIAIDHVDVLGANPAFGLNALGGAMNVQLKSALEHEGASVEVSGGSFGRISGAAEGGVRFGDAAIYGAISGLEEDGWRDHSPSSLKQAYVDIGWRAGTGEYRASIIASDNDLTGNGTAPVELLARDRGEVFTYPDQTLNETARVSLSGDWTLDDAWTLRARAYGGRLDKRSLNGDAAEVEPCEDDDDFVCGEDSDEPLTDVDGNPIANFITDSPYAADFPDFDEGGPYAFLNRSRTRTDSWGASVRAIREGELWGMLHRLSFGASLDTSDTRFVAGSELGGLSLDRGYFGPGIAVDDDEAGIGPVSVNVSSDNLGMFASDAVDLTRDVTLNLSARSDATDIKLRDQIGVELNGDHSFQRINPAAGLVWRVNPALTAYSGYAEASRAPTPAELSCADEDAPCSLANFFVADPPLEQVVARTWEAGLRGRGEMANGMELSWNLGGFRTGVSDDIQIVASEVAGRGYFTNVGRTRREGVEAGVNVETGRVRAFADYAWTRATYQTSFQLNAAGNPAFDDEDDLMTVEKGDERPGIPEHLMKAGLDFDIANRVVVGLDATWSSGRYLVGDEANLNAKTDSYVATNAHVRHEIGRGFEVFLAIENLFDEDYVTFGAFSPVDEVPVIGLPGISDPRSLSPGAPRAYFGGFRWRN